MSFFSIVSASNSSGTTSSSNSIGEGSNVLGSGGSSMGSLILIILYLIVILIAAYFVTRYVGKKAMAKGAARGGRQQSPAGKLAIIDRKSLDKEKSVVVVEFDGKFYMIGASSQGVNLIDKVEIPKEELERRAREEELRRRQQEENPKPQGISGFWVIFKSELAKKFKPSKKQSASFEEELRQKMQHEEAASQTETEIEEVKDDSKGPQS